MPADGDAGWWAGLGKAWCKHCDRFYHFRKRKFALAATSQTDAQDAPTPTSSGVSDEVTAPPIEHRELPPQSIRNGNPMKCPKCGGRGLVKTTRKGIQHRKCRECGHTYKTEKVS